MQAANQAKHLDNAGLKFSFPALAQSAGDGVAIMTREESLAAGEPEVMKHQYVQHIGPEMNERQKRSDIGTAKAVARGVNIESVRNRALAQKYMEYRRVPSDVIARVLDKPLLRRAPSTDQLVSEAITPSNAPPTTDEAED
ncbi:hypothetical protein [Pseudoduganella sp. R-34]|uniref:hypothetical protein n=1 Tax=unclassified Pseudoduganella TaxID=2637179 RepID=UPI003CF65686